MTTTKMPGSFQSGGPDRPVRLDRWGNLEVCNLSPGTTGTGGGGGGGSLNDVDLNANTTQTAVASGLYGAAIGHLSTAGGSFSLSIGYNSGALGPNCINLGYSCQSSGPRSISIGSVANAESADDIAVGLGATTSTLGGATKQIAIGTAAFTGATDTIALGTNALAGGDHSLAVGPSAQASGAFAISIGPGSIALRSPNVAIGSAPVPFTGNGANASGNGAFVLGSECLASATNSTAVGSTATSLTISPSAAIGSVALGYGSYATNGSCALGFACGLSGQSPQYSVQLGLQAVAYADYSTCVSYQALSYAPGGVAIGRQVVAGLSMGGATNSISIGYQATTNDGCIALGSPSTAAANVQCIAIGPNSVASGLQSIALATLSSAVSDDSVCIGQAAAVQTSCTQSLSVGFGANCGDEFCIAWGEFASAGFLNGGGAGGTVQQNGIAIGDMAVSQAAFSVAVGYRSFVGGNNCVAVGQLALAGAAGAGRVNALAIGPNSVATLNDNVAIGVGATATGSAAIALGGNLTTVQGLASQSVAIGQNCTNNTANSLAFSANPNPAQFDYMRLGAPNVSNQGALNALVTSNGATGVINVFAMATTDYAMGVSSGDPLVITYSRNIFTWQNPSITNFSVIFFGVGAQTEIMFAYTIVGPGQATVRLKNVDDSATPGNPWQLYYWILNCAPQ